MCDRQDVTIQITARYVRLASRDRPGHEMIPIRLDHHRPDHDQIYATKSTSHCLDHGQISVNLAVYLIIWIRA